VPECPRCKLTNPPEATRCDCGYERRLPADRQTAAMRSPVPRRSKLRVAGIALITAATVGLIGGILYFGVDAGFFVMFAGRRVAAAVVVGLVLMFAGQARK
jgi:hypothetical protein